ncbi:hypothetical protein GVN20_11965 [Runella sp. CRIBMP]|nr:hypothetical protein [Runella sp. CRIBMP]
MYSNFYASSPSACISTASHDLITAKSTGTPRQMAQRLGISERAWYYLLDQLRNDYGLPILYCRFRCSYYYTDDASHWEDFLQKFLNYPLYNTNWGW